MCCLPLGIIGIIFCNDAKNMAARGDYLGAEEKLSKGKMFTIIGIAGAGLMIVGYILLMILGVAASAL